MKPASCLCATMTSPCAAWQCAAVSGRAALHCTVSLLDRYEDGLLRMERVLFRPRTSLAAGTGFPKIIADSFRFVMNADKTGLFLSGSIETKQGNAALWDMRLFRIIAQDTQALYRAEGRIMAANREFLFPLASSFVFIQSGIAGNAAIRCSAETPAIMTSPMPEDGSVWEDASIRKEDPFRFRLPGKREAVTSLGYWADSSRAAVQRVPGLRISVI